MSDNGPSDLVDAATLSGMKALEVNRAARRARINNPRWEPKKWHPVYEEIVLLDCLGYSNKDIAEDKGFTAVHISNILNTPKAKMIRELLLKQMEKKREETIEQRLEKLADKAMDRAEKVITDDDLFAKNPLGVFDRAIIVMKGANKIKDQEEAKLIQNTMIVSDEAAIRLAKAMAGIKRREELHDKLAISIGATLVQEKEESA